MVLLSTHAQNWIFNPKKAAVTTQNSVQIFLNL